MDWLSKFVEEHLSFTGKCFRHCDKPTSMKLIHEDSSRVLGAYACPDGFVSQVVYLSQKPDINWFKRTINSQIGNENFTASDIRVATRHGWELGGTAYETLKTHLRSNSSLTEVYWTRYARTDAQKKIAISLCVGDTSRRGCLKLFAHEAEKTELFCPACRRGNDKL